MNQSERRALARATVELNLARLPRGAANLHPPDQAPEAADANNQAVRDYRRELKRIADSEDPMRIERYDLRAALAWSTGVGNCMEQACMAFAHLWRRGYLQLDLLMAPMNPRMNFGNSDWHVFLMLGMPHRWPGSDQQPQPGALKFVAEKSDYNDRVIVCDSWFHLRSRDRGEPGPAGAYTLKEYYEATVTGGSRHAFMFDDVRSVDRLDGPEE